VSAKRRNVNVIKQWQGKRNVWRISNLKLFQAFVIVVFEWGREEGFSLHE